MWVTVEENVCTYFRCYKSIADDGEVRQDECRCALMEQTDKGISKYIKQKRTRRGIKEKLTSIESSDAAGRG